MEIAAPDDVHCPTSRGGDHRRHFQPLVSGVGEDALDEGEAAARLAQQLTRPVAVFNVGGRNAHATQEAERVDKPVALAARDLLSHIEGLRAESSPILSGLGALRVDDRRRRAPLTSAMRAYVDKGYRGSGLAAPDSQRQTSMCRKVRAIER